MGATRTLTGRDPRPVRSVSRDGPLERGHADARPRRRGRAGRRLGAVPGHRRSRAGRRRTTAPPTTPPRSSTAHGPGRTGPCGSWRPTRPVGPCVARNRGLAVAHGELVAFCDDDDAWFPGVGGVIIDFLEPTPRRGGGVVVARRRSTPTAEGRPCSAAPSQYGREQLLWQNFVGAALRRAAPATPCASTSASTPTCPRARTGTCGCAAPRDGRCAPFPMSGTSTPSTAGTG